MYSVRVYYQLAKAYKLAGDTEQAILATAKMISARHGIEAWKPLQTAMAGTAYGQTLRYEIEDIEKAIAEANTSFGDA
jgi:hypothetical protein